MNAIRMMIPGFLMVLMTISVSFAQDEKPAEQGYLGIQFKQVENGNGMQVVKTIAGGPAASKLKVDDVILKFGDLKIKNDMGQFRDKPLQHKPGDVVKLTILRDGKEMTVEVKLGKRPDYETLNFRSLDGLQITAELYSRGTVVDAPLIVLCHQAGWSRGEYREIAPKLNKMGFRCLAIDQRSGGKVNDVVNETNAKAKADDKETNFNDAEQDMISALVYARGLQPGGKIILWGSSYSSALALRIAGENPKLVDGVMAFAPGEYFVRFGKPEDWITSSAKKIKVPVFITSAKDELPRWQGIYDAVPGDQKTKFVPETAGNHGSRALWEKFDDSGAYWKSVEGFLKQFN